MAPRRRWTASVMGFIVLLGATSPAVAQGGAFTTVNGHRQPIKVTIW